MNERKNLEDALTNRVLWDDGECAAQDSEADVRDVHSVDNHAPSGRLHDAEESNCERRFAGASATHNAHL